MLPLSSVIKDAFDKFEHDFQAANLPEGKYIKPPPSTAKWYNASLEKCQHSLKSTFERVKSQNQKGANSEKAAKHGYEQACEYLDFWNKTVLIQHRALTSLSKSIAHILQRELYTMGNTGLLRREAEMTLCNHI